MVNSGNGGGGGGGGGIDSGGSKKKLFLDEVYKKTTVLGRQIRSATSLSMGQ